MTKAIARAYDAMAGEYLAYASGEFENTGPGFAGLDAFVSQAKMLDGPVGDLGCGPGYLSSHLRELGLDVVGYDLSPTFVDMAREAYPWGDFHVGDLAALDRNDHSLGGIISRYSIIHTPPGRHGEVFAEWRRVLEPGAPLLLSLFGARSGADHGTSFDHAVTTAYALWPATIVEQLDQAGFVGCDATAFAVPNSRRPYDHAVIAARTPTGDLGVSADLADTNSVLEPRITLK